MCNPFVVSHDSYVGNFLVASRDIAPMEVVFTDRPAVVAPQSKPLCLVCLREVDREEDSAEKTTEEAEAAAAAFQCKGGCGVWMCGQKGCSGEMDPEGKCTVSILWKCDGT